VAALAASTNAFGVVSPDHIARFMGGMIEGLTGDDTHPTECYQTSTSVITDFEKAANRILAGDYVRGVMKMKSVIREGPLVVTECQGLKDDFEMIAEWAAIFEHPAKLTEQTVKHWLLKKNAIKDALNQEQAEWAAGNYYSAGQEAAEAMTLLVGPPQKIIGGDAPDTDEDPKGGLTPAAIKAIAEAAVKILGSFVAELVYLNRLDSISGCVYDSRDLVDEVVEMVKSISSGNEMAGLQSVAEIAGHLASAIEHCEGTPADAHLIVDWLKARSSKQALIDICSANALNHSQ